jgi:hypothetical protein
VANAAVLMSSNVNKSENRLFVRAGNADFMSGYSFRAAVRAAGEITEAGVSCLIESI